MTKSEQPWNFPPKKSRAKTRKRVAYNRLTWNVATQYPSLFFFAVAVDEPVRSFLGGGYSTVKLALG
jgi:hypothetical protein